MLLKDVKIIELCGSTSASFLGSMLSDFGAKVLQIKNVRIRYI